MVTWVPGTPLGGVTEEIVAVLTGKGTEFVDTVARLLPGVLGNEAPSAFEWFQDTGHGEGLLDCPHWTRPAEFRGWKAPEVLLGGNHEEIRKFRRMSAREKTERLRPDLIR